MRNFVTETDLKGYVPELTAYLWTGETNYSKQKERAEQTVLTDIIDRGYNISQLQKKLTLSDSSVEDYSNRLRYVINASTTGTITLYGSNNDTDFEIVATHTISVAGESTGVLTNAFAYYYITTSITCTYDLYEVQFDLLFAYKWLELIMNDSIRSEGDKYNIARDYYRDLYNQKLNSMRINVDTDGDGEEDTQLTSQTINITR
jgi:hypothetical protein